MSYQILSGNPNTEVSVVVILEGEKMKILKPGRLPEAQDTKAVIKGALSEHGVFEIEPDDICDVCNGSSCVGCICLI